jgi:maltose alpha-D-glucosyltransferase/alpha-amylase
MAYSLMFSLPGTPVLRYGQEIGMGDNLSLEGRRSVRTAMQWTDEPNSGFSRASVDTLARPIIDEGPYRYDKINAMAQRRDPDSRLNWMERMIRVRKEQHAFGWGEWSVIETGCPTVFAHACQQEDNTVIAVHNLANKTCTAELDMSDFPEGHLADLHGDRQYEPVEKDAWVVDLQSYGYRWFHLVHHEADGGEITRS